MNTSDSPSRPLSDTEQAWVDKTVAEAPEPTQAQVDRIAAWLAAPISHRQGGDPPSAALPVRSSA